MEKGVKQEQISFIKDVVANASCLVLAGVEGLNASQVSELRRNLHDANVRFKVVKNKLARIALSDSPANVLVDDFVGSTAIAWSNDNPVSPAKVLVKFEKEFEKLKLKAGFNSNVRLNVAGISALAKMPSYEELRSQMLGLFSAPATNLLGQINAVAGNLVGVLQAKIDKDKNA
ncbi:MAG TPA: 50S ribosomal protein L10 [Myxococcota bacterium]|nr:50S ribosomal protein L10 [Myxococcota bacterium]